MYMYRKFKGLVKILISNDNYNIEAVAENLLNCFKASSGHVNSAFNKFLGNNNAEGLSFFQTHFDQIKELQPDDCYFNKNGYSLTLKFDACSNGASFEYFIKGFFETAYVKSWLFEPEELKIDFNFLKNSNFAIAFSFLETNTVNDEAARSIKCVLSHYDSQKLEDSDFIKCRPIEFNGYDLKEDTRFKFVSAYVYKTLEMDSLTLEGRFIDTLQDENTIIFVSVTKPTIEEFGDSKEILVSPKPFKNLLLAEEYHLDKIAKDYGEDLRKKLMDEFHKNQDDIMEDFQIRQYSQY